MKYYEKYESECAAAREAYLKEVKKITKKYKLLYKSIDAEESKAMREIWAKNYEDWCKLRGHEHEELAIAKKVYEEIMLKLEGDYYEACGYNRDGSEKGE